MRYIKGYKNFKSLNESAMILESMLLESEVVYSSNFRNVLTKIQDPISKRLLQIETQDLDIPSNYFDIKLDNKEVVSFIPDRKVKEVLGDPKELVRSTGGGILTHNLVENGAVFSALGYVPDGEKCYKPTDREVGEVISRTVSPISGKTYVYVKFKDGQGVYNAEKLVDASEDKTSQLWVKNRQEVRVGRAVRLLLQKASSEKIHEKEIEDFVNAYKARIDMLNDKFSFFEIVEGEDILFWYHRRNYEFPGSGNLGSSCQAPGRPDWLDVYIKNPEKIKLLILKSKNNIDKIVGRALLWHIDGGEFAGRTYMDTIYVSHDSDSNLFKEYAKENGFYYQDGSDYKYRTPLITNLKPIEYRGWPSIDHMSYWNQNTGEISNQPFEGSDYIEWTQENDPPSDWIPDDYDYNEDEDE